MRWSFFHGRDRFLTFRFLQGFTGAFGLVAARAIARDLYEGVELTRFFSLLMLVNGLAPILAPVIGGQILLLASWRGVFVLLAVLGALLTVASAFAREPLPQVARIENMTKSFQTFGRLLGAAFSGTPTFAANASCSSSSPPSSRTSPARPSSSRTFTASPPKHTASSSAASAPP